MDESHIMTNHQDTSTERDLVANMRVLEADHEPDGWPAVRMREISALCDEIERLRAALASRDEASQQPQGQTTDHSKLLKMMPLSDAQIAEISVECAIKSPSDIVFARAIESAHGITAKEQGNGN